MSDREEFMKWFDSARYAMAEASTEYAMFSAWQAARSESYVLRRQAEAVDQINVRLTALSEGTSVHINPKIAIGYAATIAGDESDHLRQQADDLEQSK